MSFIPLETHAILDALEPTNPHLAKALECHIFQTLDSTNEFLKSAPLKPHVISCCLAETQTKGRGRFGRHWHSSFGENIYCTLGLQAAGDLSRLSGLSLIISLATQKVLQPYTNIPIQVKWPNDLLVNEQKLAGILIEINTNPNAITDVIIGIGININQSFKDSAHPWCSLFDITGKQFDRNQIIAAMIATIHDDIKVFKTSGLSAFSEQWDACDYLKNKTIHVQKPNLTLTGKSIGINQMGCILVEDDKGVIHTLSAGETSLKRN